MRMQTEFSLEEKLRREENGAYGGRYGCCPVCGNSEGPFNLFRANWFVCTEHLLRWCAGVNLFDHLEGEWDAWELMERFLSKYREIPALKALVRDEEADADGR